MYINRIEGVNRFNESYCSGGNEPARELRLVESLGFELEKLFILKSN